MLIYRSLLLEKVEEYKKSISRSEGWESVCFKKSKPPSVALMVDGPCFIFGCLNPGA